MVQAAEEIKLVRENLALAIALWRSAKNGKINPEDLLEPKRAHNDSDRSQRAIDRESTGQLVRCAANQIRASFALSVLQAQRSLDSVFAGDPLDDESPDLQAARCAIFLLNAPVSKDIFSPVWYCPPRYRRMFEVRSVRFALDASNIDGKALNWADFGGLERYLFLLDFCAGSAESAADARPVPVRREAPLKVQPEEPPKEDRPEEGHKERPFVIQGVVSAGPKPYEPYVAGSLPMDAIPDNSTDPVGLFVFTRCQIGEGFRSMAKDLYASYVEWCGDTGRSPAPQRNFGMRLTGLGLERRRRGRGRHWWEGIKLAVGAELAVEGRRNGAH